MAAAAATKEALRRVLVEPFDRQLERELEAELGEGIETLLDLGCGYDSPVGRVAPGLSRSVGVDLFEPYLQRSVETGIHTEYRCMDVLAAGDHFGPASFDCVVALDLIEHLPHEKGLQLLEMMERLAARKIVIFTPNGFIPQAALDDNPFQRHQSGWSAEEMRGRGYRVLGLHGWKPLRGELGVARWKPRPLWELIALWSQPLVRSRPDHAFHILCIKDLPAR
jgi:hypothetical protein